MSYCFTFTFVINSRHRSSWTNSLLSSRLLPQWSVNGCCCLFVWVWNCRRHEVLLTTTYTQTFLRALPVTHLPRALLLALRSVTSLRFLLFWLSIKDRLWYWGRNLSNWSFRIWSVLRLRRVLRMNLLLRDSLYILSRSWWVLGEFVCCKLSLRWDILLLDNLDCFWFTLLLFKLNLSNKVLVFLLLICKVIF
jgi:hypothetical protein